MILTRPFEHAFNTLVCVCVCVKDFLERYVHSLVRRRLS